MKLNRKITRLAASVLASALLVCGAALPAMAEGTTGIVQDSTEFPVTSILQVPAQIATPNVSFEYTIDVAGPANGTETKDGMTVYEGVEGGLTFKDTSNTTQTVTYDTQAPSTNLQGVKPNQYYEVTKNLTLLADMSKFTHAGIFKYEISVRDTPEVAGITHDSTKTVYVYAADTDTTNGVDAIKAIVMQEDIDAVDTKTGSFTHQYLFTDTTPDPETHSANLVLSKTVGGIYGDKSEDFAFTVTVTPKASGTSYYYECGQVGTDGGFTATTGTGLISTNTPITLQHGEAIKIYGLMSGDSYAISETDYSAKGYKTEVAIDSSDATETREASGNIQAADVKVAYTNTRASVTPTGVIMNVAPYVLMVVIAVAAAFVFLRKRRED